MIQAIGPLSIPVSYLVADALGTEPERVQARIDAAPGVGRVVLQGRF
jgi:hypothetical protein